MHSNSRECHACLTQYGFSAMCYFNLNLTSEGTILVEVIERFSMTVELAWIRCQEDPDNIQTYKK